MKMTEAAVCLILLRAMPPTFEPAVVMLRNVPEADWTIHKFTGVLRRHNEYLKQRGCTVSSHTVETFAAYVDYTIPPPPIPFQGTGTSEPAFAHFTKGCKHCYSTSHSAGDLAYAHLRIRTAIWGPYKRAKGGGGDSGSKP